MSDLTVWEIEDARDLADELRDKIQNFYLAAELVLDAKNRDDLRWVDAEIATIVDTVEAIAAIVTRANRNAS